MYEQNGYKELEHRCFAKQTPFGEGCHRAEHPARGALNKRGLKKARGQLQDPACLARPVPQGGEAALKGKGPDAQVKALENENKQLKEALAEMALRVEVLKKLRRLG